MTNRDGGTVDINGLVTDTSQGINLSTNGTGLVRFDGGITASTEPTPPSTHRERHHRRHRHHGATAPNNTLTTTTGTALNVANTTIHADDLTFQSISAARGADLRMASSSTTPARWRAHVTGDGGGSNDGTGGTIQNTTSHGVSLTSTFDVALAFMNIVSNDDAGIKGINVTNFSLNRSNVNNNGNSTSDEGIQFGEFSGTTSA